MPASAELVLALIGGRAPGDELPVPEHTAEEAHDVVRSVLSDPRYRVPARSLTDRILDWINDRLNDLFTTLLDTGAGSLLAWIVIIVTVAGLGFLLLRYGRTVQRDASAGVVTMVELTRTPTEWRAEANELEAAGRWKEGLRCRYRALVGELVGRGHIPELPGRTSGEYRIDVAERDPAAAAPFAAASELFELAWYGDAPTGSDESTRFQDLEAEVLQRVGVAAVRA